ncbi:MAG TPA: beta-galactosidase [Tepidiformaceae bacterium]
MTPDGPSRRRVTRAFAAWGAGALACTILLAGFAYLFVRLSWPHVEAAGNPAFGINFSCDQAEYLLLEDPSLGTAGYVSRDRPGRAEWCAARLDELLAGLGVRYVRISVEWSQVEPAPGLYDFSLVDALLGAAEAREAKVLLTVGVKGQRHPEYYIPQWVLDGSRLKDSETVSDDPFLRAHALEMVSAVVSHVAGSAAIDSWSADNEPYVASPRANGWVLGEDFVREEVGIIRTDDPTHRPVVINHAQHFVFDRRWKVALADSDVLGTSIYPFRRYDIAGQEVIVPILEIGPLQTNYAAQARAAKAAGRDFWITEMQAEPWSNDIRLVSPTNPADDLTPAHFQDNIDYARRTGASRVYLWGAEWWLYERDHFGDSRWWNMAKAAILPGTER